MRKLRKFELSTMNRDNILYASKFYEDKTLIKILSLRQRFEYLVLIRFFEHSTSFLASIEKEHKDFNLKEEEIKEICQNHFSIYSELKDEDEEEMIEVIDLYTFFEFYHKRMDAKILVTDFMDISLDYMIKLYNEIEIKLINLYQRFANQNLLFYTEFDAAMKKIFANSENKWKSLEYFR